MPEVVFVASLWNCGCNLRSSLALQGSEGQVMLSAFRWVSLSTTQASYGPTGRNRSAMSKEQLLDFDAPGSNNAAGLVDE